MPLKPRPTQHEPVGAALTHEAEAAYTKNRRHFWKRTDRRLAITAAGVFLFLTTSMCGAAQVITADAVKLRQHHVMFEQARAEFDCCEPGALTAERCQEAKIHLDALHQGPCAGGGGPSVAMARGEDRFAAS